MNVLFDHQTFSLQTYGGISRYYAELISGINKTDSHNASISLLFSNNIHLYESGLHVKPFFPSTNFRGKGTFVYKANQLYSTAKLRENKYSVFHPTYYDPYFIPYLKGRPFVATFLDMIHEKFSAQYSEFKNDELTTRQKNQIAHAASRIIAISESTKRDVVELLNVDPAKIEVIYLGNSLAPLPIESNSESAKLYLLFVGNRERYKNFEGLLLAIHPLLKKYKLTLLCAGGGAFSQDERALISSVGAEAFVEQQPINDRTLPTLYQKALAFIFPSLYEGFGIPVLEAFACNCPCIVSNTSSLPEVAGGAALYIDPNSAESMLTVVERLVLDETLRNELIQKGRERLTLFSWNRTVNETINLYKTLV